MRFQAYQHFQNGIPWTTPPQSLEEKFQAFSPYIAGAAKTTVLEVCHDMGKAEGCEVYGLFPGSRDYP